jgi:hypothetical protein
MINVRHNEDDYRLFHRRRPCWSEKETVELEESYSVIRVVHVKAEVTGSFRSLLLRGLRE